MSARPAQHYRATTPAQSRPRADHRARDAAYRAVLGLDDGEPLPRRLGRCEGHAMPMSRVIKDMGRA
jgi:hypothetical protein